MSGPSTSPGEPEPLFEVLDPCGTASLADETPLAPRLAALEGKVVFCISQFVGGADTLLRKIADALPAQLPGVRTVYLRKESTYMADDPALWERIGREGHAVIYGCAA